MCRTQKSNRELARFQGTVWPALLLQVARLGKALQVSVLPWTPSLWSVLVLTGPTFPAGPRVGGLCFLGVALGDRSEAQVP